MKKSHVLSLVALLGLSAACLAQDAPPPPPAAPAPAAGQQTGGRGGPGGGRGNWDPAQMRERMLSMVQERIGASADEWKVISPLLQGAMEKERATRELQGGRGGGRRGGQQGGPQGQSPDAAPEVAALEKAIDAKDNAAIKTAMEVLRKARTDRAAEATKAKAALREVLSVSQEARLVAMGILD